MHAVVSNSAKFRLDGRSAVVTGGANGIGFAIASTFALAGAKVHIIDLTLEDANKAARQIVEAGGTAEGHACNVADQAEVDRVFGDLLARERIHILVNNAGISGIGRVDTTAAADFDRVIQVNIKSVYHCTRACIRSMADAGGGVILNMASISATSGLEDRFSYSMSKGAVLAMTFSIARDFLTQNIRCNAISPARVHTGFVDGYLAKNYPGREAEMFEKLSASQPIGRMGEPEEVANLALYLCSDEASFLTGVNYPLDGGFVNLRG
jgi:2-keto-3-deoxy-L-fuconate dehydrogenase